MQKTMKNDVALKAKADQNYVSLMLRGGRMTKVAGVTASYAPCLGRVRTALSTGAIVLGAAMALPSIAEAQVADTCATSGATVTCTGDLASGVSVSGPWSGAMEVDPTTSTLVVENVTSTQIAPATDVDGISFFGEYGALVLHADTTGSGGIHADGLGNGIDAFVPTDGSLTITHAGDISVDADTANLDTYSRGAGNGINANLANSGAISITHSGNISISRSGPRSGIIDDRETGRGIPTGVGISAATDGVGSANSSDISIVTTGDISSVSANGADRAGNGIDAEVMDNGNIAIQHTGNVSGDTAIAARLGGATSRDLSIEVDGNVTGQNEGIFAVSGGKGDVFVSVEGNVEANSTGIFVDSFVWADGSDHEPNFEEKSGNTTIETTGTVHGGRIGIIGMNRVAGDLVIKANNVSSADQNGILAENVSSPYDGASPSEYLPGSLSVTTTGTVSGGANGIYALNQGTGALTIAATSNGAAQVTGGANGIEARNENGSTLSIDVDTATGGSNGVLALNAAGGDLHVTAQNASGASEDGISAYINGTGALTVTTNGNVSGGDTGILAEIDEETASETDQASPETSSITIDSTGSVTGGEFDAILAKIRGSGTIEIRNAATLNVTDVDGKGDGIDADILGTDAESNSIGGNGAVTITNTGDIHVVSTEGEYSSAGDGIDADIDGDGDMVITNVATITSDNGHAISADLSGNGSITIEHTGTLSGGKNGILAENGGEGFAEGTALSITSAGAVSGTTNGIEADNFGTGDLTITATNADDGTGVSGGMSGISAVNRAGGALTIDAQTVTGAENDGILASNTQITSTALSIDVTGDVSGGNRGIYAFNQGSGGLTVTAADDTQITGQGGGIVAKNSFGGDVNISANNVRTNVADAIEVVNGSGTQSMRVTTTGSVQSDGRSGIITSNFGSGDLTITATNSNGTAQVTGNTRGVSASNATGGNLTIDVDNATGVNREGVFGWTDAADGDLTITSTGTVSGGADGISATKKGTGNLTVAATNSDGTATVSGDQNGIRAKNTGGGYARIEADTVSGEAEDGIYGSNDSDGSSLTIIAHGVVTGDDTGILAQNSGTEGLTIEATNNGDGQVTARFDGINAVNQNGGALSIEADNVRGENEDGIYAKNEAGDGGLAITTTGDVTGGEDGIEARNDGTGDLTVTVSGATSGTNGAGITTATAAGATSVITLNEGADVSGATAAIQNTAGDSSVFFNAGAKISGGTLLGDGSDTLTIAANADISAVTLLDGGDGSGDTLTLSGFDGDFGADLTGWEDVTFDAAHINFTGHEISEAVVSQQIATVSRAAQASVSLADTFEAASNSLTSQQVSGAVVSLKHGTVFRPTQADFSLAGGLNIDADSTFDATHGGAGTVALTGNLDNGGTITLSDDAAGDQITVSGDLQGAGRLMLDADIRTGTGDRVAVDGDVTGTGQISVNALGTDGTPEAITLVTVGGSASADAFALASANATTPEGENVQVVGAFTYRLAFDDVAGEFAFTPFDANGNVAFNSIANVLEAYPAQLALLNTPGAMFQSWANRAGVASGDTGTATRNLFNFVPSAETALWFRAYGTKATYEGTSSSNSAVDTSVSAFELGVDLPAIETGSGRLLVGASFAKQTAQSDIITSTNSGGIDTDGAALSLNALWQSDSQFYAGAQLRYSNFSSDLSLGGLGPVVLGTEGEGVAASIEIGKAFAVSERLTLVPQVQLTHSKISGDTIADPFGQPFVGVITDGTTSSARIGLRAEYVTDTGSFYGAVSYIHGLDTKTSVDYAGQTLSTELDPNRIELRAGGQVAISDTTQLYGEINYQAGLADMGNDNAYSLSVGVKIRF